MDQQRRDVRVCFVGDSFVAGHGDSSGLGWVGRVSVAALRRGVRLTGYGLGVRRQTSEQIASRVAAEVGPRLAPAEDPRVVLSFGVNDTALEAGSPRVPLPRTLQALREVRAAIAPVPLLLAGPPAVADESQNARIARTSDALREECAALGVPFVDCFAATSRSEPWRREVRDGDGFHPDAGGYEVLAAVLAPPIVGWLEDRV